MSNGKAHFGLTDRNVRTGRSELPSKVVPNIPVEANQTFRYFGLDKKRPR